MDEKSFLVSQLTARRNYDVASILNSANRLNALVTDMYDKPSVVNRFLKSTLPNRYLHSYRSCRNNSISDDRVFSNDLSGIYFKYRLAKYPKLKYKAYLAAFKKLNSLSVEVLNKTKTHNIYAFDTAAKELFEYGFKNDKNLVLEQCVASRQKQIEMYNLFNLKYGVGFEKEIENAKILQEREEKEWELANQILCPSPFVINSLEYAGVDKSKIKLIPYGVDIPFKSDFLLKNIEDKFSKKNDKIIVLYVGNSDYRKGIQDLTEIAKSLRKYSIEFVVAGSISASIIEKLEINDLDNVKFLGKITKDKLFEEYLTSDIFFLPSYLEGSAIVGLEALGFGLPIITTYESGTIIKENIHGFVSNAGDLDSMVNSIMSLSDNKDLRYKMAIENLSFVNKYSEDEYKKNLINVI
jgi:glycosyltransferase involved in cell wall biosynthesis